MPTISRELEGLFFRPTGHFLVLERSAPFLSVVDPNVLQPHAPDSLPWINTLVRRQRTFRAPGRVGEADAPWTLPHLPGPHRVDERFPQHGDAAGIALPEPFRTPLLPPLWGARGRILQPDGAPAKRSKVAATSAPGRRSKPSTMFRIRHQTSYATTGDDLCARLRPYRARPGSGPSGGPPRPSPGCVALLAGPLDERRQFGELVS